METLHIKSEEQLNDAVQRALKLLAEQKRDGASVLAINGDLGAGKTAFVKALASHFGIDEDVTSPTFVIMKKYDIDEDPQGKYSSLCHIDAYRIESQDEMRVLRFGDVLKEEGTLVCIEWAERITELLPSHTVHMRMAISGPTSREITFA